MPLVSATDVPIQPYPTGRTSPQAPDAYERIPTSPSMFGALQAEALEKAGAQGEKLATEVARIGAYQQRMQDLAELDQLAAIRDDRLHKEKYGDPEAGIDLATGKPRVPGIKNMLGVDALDYIRSGAPNKAYENIVGSLAGSASSDRVRQLFLHQSRAQRVAFDNVVGEHWNQQLQAHNAAVLKANDYNVSRTITKGYNNDVELETAINQKIDFLTRGVTDPEIRAARYYAAVTEGASDAIQAALADNNPRRAAQLLNAYKDHMDGDAISKLHPRVQHALDELTIAEALLGRGATSTNAVEHYNTAISLGASPNEAALLTSAASAESGFDPTKSHDGGIGYGLYGHNAERLAAMQKQFGARPTAAQQIEFALNELRSRPEGARVNDAKTPEELTELQFQFEQPKRGPGDQAAARLAMTRELMRNPPKAAAAPSTPPPASAPGTPAPPAPAPPRPRGTGPIEVWGDSLGVGLKGALKAEGHTVGGQSPSAILADIKSQPADYWNGKLIALASGSNRSEMDKVEETIKYLQEKKADVALVGYGPIFPEKNAKLRELAQKYNVPVIDAEGFGPKDGVHPGPQGYQSMAGRVRALRSAPIIVPRPDPNAPPPPGMIKPGNMSAPIPLIPPNIATP